MTVEMLRGFWCPLNIQETLENHSKFLFDVYERRLLCYLWNSSRVLSKLNRIYTTIRYIGRIDLKIICLIKIMYDLFNIYLTKPDFSIFCKIYYTFYIIPLLSHWIYLRKAQWIYIRYMHNMNECIFIFTYVLLYVWQHTSIEFETTTSNWITLPHFLKILKYT